MQRGGVLRAWCAKATGEGPSGGGGSGIVGDDRRQTIHDRVVARLGQRHGRQLTQERFEDLDAASGNAAQTPSVVFQSADKDRGNLETVGTGGPPHSGPLGNVAGVGL